MKKITLTVFAFFLTVSLTGCASQQTDKPHTIGTKPPIVTEEGEPDYVDYYEDTVKTFDNYNAFLADYTARGDAICVYPFPEIINEWVSGEVEFEDTVFYRTYFTNPQDDCDIMVEIQPATHFATVDEYLESLSGNYTYGDISIVKQTDRWYIEKYTEDARSSYALYGFTGEENVYYALAVSDPNNPEPTDEDAIALLENYQDLLEFQKTS